MSDKSTTHVIRGTLHWAKVLGAPRLNTYTEEKEWSVDLTPDEAGRAEIKRIGISSKLREPKANDSRKDSFLSFRQRELKKDGSKNDPIKVTDVRGNPWDQSTLIGNGTIADVKFRMRKYPGKPAGTYISAIRILKLVPYEVQEFAPISEDDEFFAEDEFGPEPQSEVKAAPSVDDLDDDFPE